MVQTLANLKNNFINSLSKPIVSSSIGATSPMAKSTTQTPVAYGGARSQGITLGDVGNAIATGAAGFIKPVTDFGSRNLPENKNPRDAYTQSLNDGYSMQSRVPTGTNQTRVGQSSTVTPVASSSIQTPPQNPQQYTLAGGNPAFEQPQTPQTIFQTPSGANVDSRTGNLLSPEPTAPKADPYGDAYKAYISSLAPSSAETDATSYLNNLTLQSKKDYEKALESGETQGFASGEAARVNRNNAFGIEAAANTVNALTGQRTANTNQAKARIDYENSLRGNTDPYTLSAGQTRYDSSGNVIASAPKDVTAADGFTLSSGEQRYDANGKLIASGAPDAGADPNELLSVAEANTLGLPYGTTRGQAFGSSAVKVPTADQSLSNNYGTRIAQANQIIDSIGDEFTGAFSGLGGAAPNFLKSSDRQQYEQAQSNFINAVLRKESGAAIAPSEFESAQKQYFPQPGDSKEVVAQKKANRDLVQKNFLQGAGPAAQNNQNSAPTGNDVGIQTKYGIINPTL